MQDSFSSFWTTVKKKALRSHINVRADTYASQNVNREKCLRLLILKEKTEGDQRKRKSTFERKDSREKEKERERVSLLVPGTGHLAERSFIMVSIPPVGSLRTTKDSLARKLDL